MDRVIDVEKRLKEYREAYNKWRMPGLYISNTYYKQTIDHLNKILERANHEIKQPKIIVIQNEPP